MIRYGFNVRTRTGQRVDNIMIMAATQIIDRNPNPSREEIRHGLEGNLCRCTGYQHIVEAVEYAAKKTAGN